MEQIKIKCLVSCLKDGDGDCWYGRALGIADGGKGTMKSLTTRLHQASGFIEICRVTAETVGNCFRNWCATVLVDSAADDADCQCDDGATTACCAAKAAACSSPDAYASFPGFNTTKNGFRERVAWSAVPSPGLCRIANCGSHYNRCPRQWELWIRTGPDVLVGRPTRSRCLGSEQQVLARDR